MQGILFDTLTKMSAVSESTASAEEPTAEPAQGVHAVFAAARLARHLELALADVELTLPQLRLLIFLAERPGAAKQLANRTQVRPPSLTALVDGLAQRGLVERKPDPDDGRKIQLVMTPAGRLVLEAGVQACQTRLEHIADYHRQDDAIDALSTWVGALDGWRAENSP